MPTDLMKKICILIVYQHYICSLYSYINGIKSQKYCYTLLVNCFGHCEGLCA